MKPTPLNPNQIAQLIDHVLKSRDPATVGLQRILKNKEEMAKGFPCRSHEYTHFGQGGGKLESLSEDEKRILQLEKECNLLRGEMRSQEQKLRREIDTARQDGIRQGHEDGVKKAESQFNRQLDQRVSEIEERLAVTLSRIDTERRKVLVSSEAQVTNLAMAVARKIIATEIEENAEVVVKVVRKALALLSDREHLTIRVSPMDIQTAQEKKELWSTVADRLDNVSLRSDSGIEPGGCIIESASGVADARIGVQFDELYSLVASVWEETKDHDEPDESPLNSSPEQ